MDRHPIVLALILAGIVFVVLGSARTAAVLIELRPSALKDGQIRAAGFAFQIGSERLSTGAVRFGIRITEDGAAFSQDQLSVALGRLTQTRNSISIDPIRSLSALRDGHSAACAFEVSDDTLSSRAAIFSFTNPATDGQGHPMPAATIYFVRLADFIRR